MENVSTIGLDIAKHAFQVHGIDAGGAVVIRRRLRCADVATFFASLPPSLIGVACELRAVIADESCPKTLAQNDPVLRDQCSRSQGVLAARMC